MTNAVVGMVTCSSRTEARKVARAILTKKLAACVNIVSGLESHYWWQGKLETAREYLLLIKTTRARTGGITSAVKPLSSTTLPLPPSFLPSHSAAMRPSATKSEAMRVA